MSGLRAGCRFLAISILLLCFSLPVFAETPADPLPEVVISSTRLPGDKVNINDIPAKVTVITADQIRQSGAQTIQEAIQYETGVVVYDLNGNPNTSTVDLRGFSGQPSPSTSVFVDGVRLNEPDSNVTNFDLIPLESIERIEIIPGSSAIYGKSALGGVINIITKRGGDRRQITAETAVGSFHRERYALNSSGPLGKFDYATSFTRETENGYRNESDSRISRYFGKLGFRPTDETDLTLSYNYTKDRLLQAGSLDFSQIAINRERNVQAGSFQANELNFVSVGGRQKLPLGLTLSINGFYRHRAQENLTVFTFGGQSDLASKVESKGGTVQLSHEQKSDQLTNTISLGAEMTRTDFGSGVVGFPAFSGRQSIDEDIHAFFAQNSLEIARRVIVTAGLRYDHDQQGAQTITAAGNTIVPESSGGMKFLRTTPRIGIVYKLDPRVSLYVNYAEGFRPPTFNERFAQPGFTSNPQLRPARTRGYEIGGKAAMSNWGHASLAFFQTDARDEIFFSCIRCDFSLGDGVNRNIGKSRRRGMEASLRADMDTQWTVVLNYTYTEAIFKTAFNSGSLVNVVDAGDSFPLVPKNRLGTTLQYRPAPEWVFSLNGLYVSPQFYNNDEANNFPRIAGYFVLGGRVSYKRNVPGGKIEVFLQGNNLLDKHYFTAGSVNSSGFPNAGGDQFLVPSATRAVYFGISYRFDEF